jgi:hypothetical protein
MNNEDILKKYYVYVENQKVPFIIRTSNKKQIFDEWNHKKHGKITSIMEG